MLICRVSTENEITIWNLQLAYECELNAYSSDMAYADRADTECAFESATLFRSIGRSDKIQANNHARVIRQLGGEPEAIIRQANAKTTRDNLTTALEEKVYEVESMYPRFLTENRSTDNSAARTFMWALAANRIAVQFLTEAINQMECGKGCACACAALEFYVRPVCGLISKSVESERCWACEHFCKTFEVIR